LHFRSFGGDMGEPLVRRLLLSSCLKEFIILTQDSLRFEENKLEDLKAQRSRAIPKPSAPQKVLYDQLIAKIAAKEVGNNFSFLLFCFI
jgi:hypothetical protein